MLQDADALPQLIGDYKPVDQWQAHINQLFYRVRGDQIRRFYQTFASADYRLAHALASDYFENVTAREKAQPKAPAPRPALTVVELGPGNGNLAACFLSHLKTLDRDGQIYPHLTYVFVDWEQTVLDTAMSHPGLASHRDRVQLLRSTVDHVVDLPDESVDRIFCNELWNDLPTKLMSRHDGEIEEEFLRPNLSDALHAKIQDWAGFIRAFEAKDVDQLKQFPPFLDDLVWEREYRTVEWKDVPYRKTITEFLRRIDDQVVVPVNVGAYASIKEAKRLLAQGAFGLSSFDAGTADLKVLNDPDKPCSGQFGGQQSYMVNFALADAVARQMDAGIVSIESQREFIGRSLGTNVLTLMDLLATHPSAGKKLEPWEQDRLILNTIKALNETYQSPYTTTIEFPVRSDMSTEERDRLHTLIQGLKPSGIPDTIAYITEDELMQACRDLEEVGYDPQLFHIALTAPPAPVDYFHVSIRPR
jgi:SAM-dependent MidA family methyltransferase